MNILKIFPGQMGSRPRLRMAALWSWALFGFFACGPVFLLCPFSASAEEILSQEAMKATAKAAADAEEPADEEDRWSVKLTLGATANAAHSSQVVGQTDGTTLQAGTILSGNALFTEGPHRWRTHLLVELSQMRTSALERFIKSGDNLELESLYIYRFSDPSWLGTYLRGRAQSNLFPGYLVRSDDLAVTRTYRDETEEAVAAQAYQRVDLTGSFEPLRITEGVGLTSAPVEQKRLTLTVQAGVGGQHVLVRDGFAVADDSPDAVALVQLSGSNSLGAEAEVEAKGQVADNLEVTAKINFFYPVLSTADTDLTGLDTLHTELRASLSLKLRKWLSLDYLIQARKLPFVVDKWQVQNSLLLSAGFNLL